LGQEEECLLMPAIEIPYYFNFILLTFSYKSLPTYSAFGVASFSCEFGSGKLAEH